MTNYLNRLFHFTELHTNLRQEIIAGCTTFLTMVYIIIVNPTILSHAGLPNAASFLATCLVAACGSILCGFFANYPIALAPSMSLSAYFAFGVVGAGLLPLNTALVCVGLSGLLLGLLTLLQVRHWLVKALPTSLTYATSTGIGLFIGVIGLKELGVITPNPQTLLSLGDLTTLPICLGLLGYCLMILFDYYRIHGGILVAIIVVSGISHFFGLSHSGGFFAAPPALNWHMTLPDWQHLFNLHGCIIIFTFLMVALFDSTGTFLGLLHQAKFDQTHLSARRINKAFYAESITSMSAGILGTSAAGPYVENATGIASGGRSGFCAILVGLLFLLMTFLSPLVYQIPLFAAAPALLFVASKMCSQLIHINWEDSLESFPAVLIILLIPLTFSIANGIACGFIVYFLMHLCCGQIKKLNTSAWVLFVLFVLYIILVTHH